MNDVRVKLKLSGLNKVMRSPAVQAEVNARAARVSAEAGPKYRMVVYPHRYSARAFVEPVAGAKISDADNARLLRALNAARAK
ncbi:hypothetical protein G7068_03290 [Leucobacter viscericola]|uniref:Uncharacterized protein n=1 Tax=Leucobacter viscericola TaxID=2714935 RepID=A0A6G7XD20_9MICO|nr:hypothetical protein [Leucobacter viscericola]QIK62339.1 hypothetical protein G7068_03290 [Leucobacter viscericola]